MTHQQKFFEEERNLPEGWVRGTPGFIKTTEAKEKTRKFHLGRKRSEETRQNMRNATRGKRLTVPYEKCDNQFTKQNIKRHQAVCKGE